MSKYEKILKPVIDEIIAEKRAVGIAASEIKKTKAIQKQEREDLGLARAIIGQHSRGIDVHKAQMAAVVEIEKTKALQKAELEEGRDKIARAVSEAKQDLIDKVKEAELKQQVAIVAADEATELIEEAVLSVDDIIDNHADWINAYEEKTGKKAIWQGRITEGFKSYIELNGFK